MAPSTSQPFCYHILPVKIVQEFHEPLLFIVQQQGIALFVRTAQYRCIKPPEVSLYLLVMLYMSCFIPFYIHYLAGIATPFPASNVENITSKISYFIDFSNILSFLWNMV